MFASYAEDPSVLAEVETPELYLPFYDIVKIEIADVERNKKIVTIVCQLVEDFPALSTFILISSNQSRHPFRASEQADIRELLT